ncbi:hypothetical protein LCGC14_1579700 [marine sediment metagenome]|uniref:AAA+ ATPase domain-containing protein n=1 Tax=marine sediment metagenome TaxID=412755 RepID=A0A0F9IHD4_9ZZZZ
MPKVKTLAKLFRAIADRDWGSAVQLARAVASEEESIGHRTAAQALRGSLNPNGKVRSRSAMTEDTGNHAAILGAALQPVRPALPLGDVVLRSAAREALDEVILEWRRRNRLQEAGLRHRANLLFHGPSGCGKSLTASALGAELGIPTYVVRFDAVVGAFLGQTALHLRELFRHAEMEPCVLVFDEIDALGKQRGNPLDVGELDRIVIALMQELEHCEAQGLVIATTNLATHLDAALWRRFDLTIKFPSPTKTEMAAYVRRTAKALGVRMRKRLRAEALRSKSFAGAEGVLVTEARRRVVREG